MTKLTCKQLGDAGENLVSLVFQQLGHDVSLSENKYDDEKDALVDGVPTEIKTQTIFRFFSCENCFRGPAFTIDIESKYGKIYYNQLNKCKTVDRLIFVARSSFDDPTVRIYEAPSPSQRNFRITRNKYDGRKVAGILISELTLLKEIRNKKIVEYFMDDWRYNAKSKRYSR